MMNNKIQKMYDIILNDRKHLTDYERDQLIPEIKSRLLILIKYFNEVIALCEVQKNSTVFNQVVQQVMNPNAFEPDSDSPTETPSEKFFSGIKENAQTQGVDDINSILKKYENIESVSQLGLFLTEANNLCSALLNVNNDLLLYKIETYPYITNVKTKQTAVTAPVQYSITIEPFQILVTNIVFVARWTSESINEWHKHTLKLKSQFLDLYISRVNLKNTKYVLYFQLLTVILAIALSAVFLFANDPFNLYKENQNLKRAKTELEFENINLKNIIKTTSSQIIIQHK